MSRMLSNCTHLHGHEFQPCSPAPLSPVTGFPALFSWDSATNTAGTRHLQFLYTGTVCSSSRTFFRKGGEREKKKTVKKIFCSLAVLEIFKLRTVTTPLSQQINLKQNKTLCFLKYKGHHRIRCHQNIPLIQNQQQIRLLPSSLGGQ